MERSRDRKFRLLLYPEDSTHVEAMKILDEAGYKYAAILHDKDTWDSDDTEVEESQIGQLKKPHWHVVVKFPNAIWSTSLADSLGIATNYIFECKNLDGALLYLVHANHLDKHQYNIEEVFGELKNRLPVLLADDKEEVRVMKILDFIRNSPGPVSYTEIFVKAIDAGLYGDFRRMGSGVKSLIADHNSQFDCSVTNAERFGAFVERSGNSVSLSRRVDILKKNKLVPDKVDEL